MTYSLAILPGDGIGPEVMEEAITLFPIIEQKYSVTFTYKKALVGGIAIDTQDTALPQETLDICSEAQAILFGSIGGPKWESLPTQQPERAALLPLRKHFELFANLRSALLFKELIDASPLKKKNYRKRF